MVAFILLIVGGLNWLLYALLGEDLFGLLGMDMSSSIAKIVYVLVGLSAIYEVATHKKNCKVCNAGANAGGAM